MISIPADHPCLFFGRVAADFHVIGESVSLPPFLAMDYLDSDTVVAARPTHSASNPLAAMPWWPKVISWEVLRVRWSAIGTRFNIDKHWWETDEDDPPSHKIAAALTRGGMADTGFTRNRMLLINFPYDPDRRGVERLRTHLSRSFSSSVHWKGRNSEAHCFRHDLREGLLLDAIGPMLDDEGIVDDYLLVEPVSLVLAAQDGANLDPSYTPLHRWIAAGR